MKITEHLAMLEISNERTIFPVLVWDDQNLVLIDTGFPGQFSLFQKAIEENGFQLSQLTHILLTHEDLDHIGCLKELVAASPGVRVLAHHIEAESISGQAPPNKVMANAAKKELSPEEKEQLEQRIANYKLYTVSVDQLLNDGEVIPLCGGIEVIHTPGHTAGHVCYYMIRDKVIMTGDTVGVNGDGLMGPVLMHTPYMEQAVQSNRKLESTPAEALIAYHGGLFRGDVAAAIKALSQN